MTDRLEKISIALGGIGLGVAAIGCLGGNALIGAAHGILGLSLITYLVFFFTGRPQRGLSQKVEIRPSLVALMLVTVFGIISMAANWGDYPSPLKDLKKFRYEIIVIVFLLIPFFREQLLKRADKLKWVIWLGLGSAVVIVAAGFLGVAIGFNPLTWEGPKVEGRVGGVSGSQMTFGYTLQFMVLLVFSKATSLVKEQDRDIKQILLYSGVFLVLFLGLFFSYCRGSLFALGFGILTILILLRNWKLWLGIAGFVLVVFLISLSSHTRYTDYLGGLVRGGAHLISGDRIRVNQWEAAALTFLDHPMFGIGYRQFEKQSDQIKEEYGFEPVHPHLGFFRGHAHSNYLEAFAATGIFGGLAFLAFCLFWYYEMFRSTHAKLYFLPVAVAFIVSGFFENTFTDSEVLHTILLIYFFSQLVLDWEERKGEENEAIPG